MSEASTIVIGRKPMSGNKWHVGYSIANDTWFVRSYGFATQSDAEEFQASISTFSGDFYKVFIAAQEIMAVTELSDMACTGSDAPAEHALGLLKDALKGQKMDSTPELIRSLKDHSEALRIEDPFAAELCAKALSAILDLQSKLLKND